MGEEGVKLVVGVRSLWEGASVLGLAKEVRVSEFLGCYLAQVSVLVVVVRLSFHVHEIPLIQSLVEVAEYVHL